MSTAKDFHELVIWQRSHALVLSIYRATASFPAHEQFGLKSQLQRAAVSIPSNIAEGFERETSKDFYHFLVMSRGSLAEVQAQLLIAKDLEFLADERYVELYDETVEIHKMLNKFLTSLKTSKLATKKLGD